MRPGAVNIPRDFALNPTYQRAPSFFQNQTAPRCYYSLVERIRLNTKAC